MKTIITAHYQFPGNSDATLVRATFDGQLSEHVAELVGLGLLWKVGASSSGEARVEHEHRDGAASGARPTDAELRDRVERMQAELTDALGITGEVSFDDLLVCVREQRRELQARDAEVRRLRDRLCERPQFGGSQCALTFGTVADSFVSTTINEALAYVRGGRLFVFFEHADVLVPVYGNDTVDTVSKRWHETHAAKRDERQDDESESDASGIWVRAKDLRVGDRAGQDGATVEITDHDGDWYAVTHTITRTSFRDGAIMHEYVERTTAAGEALPGWTFTEDATARGSMAPIVWGEVQPPAVAVFDHDADSISIRQNGMHTTIANEASAVHKYLGVGADERSMLRERLLRQVRRSVGFQWLVGRGTQVVVGTIGRVVTGERAYVDPNADDLLRGWSTSQCPGFVWAGTWMRPVSNTPDMAIVELGGELFEGAA